MVNKMGLDSFIQICIVVENMEEAVKSWSAMFNIPEPEIVVNKPNRIDRRNRYLVTVASSVSGIGIPFRIAFFCR